METAERKLKIAAAAMVLAVGLAAALLFRRDAPALPERPAGEAQLVLREQVLPPTAVAPITVRSAPLVASAEPAKSAPAVDPHPSLPREYPGAIAGPTSRLGTWMLLGSGGQWPHHPRRHIIVDGDTLATLAKRYLGSSERAAELYAINRDVLNSPDWLPIGVELKIPPASDQ